MKLGNMTLHLESFAVNDAKFSVIADLMTMREMKSRLRFDKNAAISRSGGVKAVILLPRN